MSDHPHAIEHGAGDIIVRGGDGSEGHIFLVDRLGDGEPSEAPLKKARDLLKEEFGPSSPVGEEHFADLDDGWPRSLKWTRFAGPDYAVELRAQEIDVGASGWTDQIVIAIATSVMGSAVWASLVAAARAMFPRRRDGVGGRAVDPLTTVEEYLKHRCGAHGKLEISQLGTQGGRRTLSIVDELGNSFRLTLDDDGSVIALLRGPNAVA